MSSIYPKEIKSKQTFQYGNKSVEYILIQSKRRKTFEVTVDRNEIVIRSPFDKSIKDIEQILNDKIKWISQKQREIQTHRPEIIKPTFDDNTTLPYLGENCKLKVIYTTKDKIEFTNNMFTVYLNKKENRLEEKIKSLYNNWLYNRADQLFKEKVYQFSKIIDVAPNQIIVKNLKNRWGSITKNKTVNLNVNLLKAPEDVMDYIIIHELCHLKIKGHSHKFWNYLKQFIPDYNQKIEWLRINSKNLIQ